MTASNISEPDTSSQRWAVCPRVVLHRSPDTPAIFESEIEANKFLDSGSPIPRREQGWHDPVPVFEFNQLSRRKSGRSFREFLKTEELDPMPTLDVRQEVARALDDRFGVFECCLDTSWRFDEIESRLRKRSSHEYEGRKNDSFEAIVLRMVHDMEEELVRQHPNISDRAAGIFWCSWQIHAYIADFCTTLADSNCAIKMASCNSINAREKTDAARKFICRQLLAFAYELASDPPINWKAISIGAEVLDAAEDWRAHRADFETLSKSQRDELGIDREHHRWLTGHCSHFDEEAGRFGCCEIDGGLDNEFRCRWEDVATQAAIGLGVPAGWDSVEFWVTCLCVDLLGRPDFARTELLESPTRGAIIRDLLASSGAYCSRLAAGADIAASRRGFRITDLGDNRQSGKDEVLPAEKADERDDPVPDEWVRVPRATWQEDADLSLEPQPFFRRVQSDRLTAINTLWSKATVAFETALPATTQEAEACLWPLISEYATTLFDGCTESLLSRHPQINARSFARWLRSKCVEEVIVDICKPVVGQLFITPRHVVEALGDSQAQKRAEARRALWGILKEVLGGPVTTNTRNRLGVHLQSQVVLWEGRRARVDQSATKGIGQADKGKSEEEGTLAASQSTSSGDVNQSMEQHPPTKSKKARRHGFAANMDRHNAIERFVSKHAPLWRKANNTWKSKDVLKVICDDLDASAASEESDVYDTPDTWKSGGPEVLKGAKVTGWADAYSLSPKLVGDQIMSSLKMVLKHEAQSVGRVGPGTLPDE